MLSGHRQQSTVLLMCDLPRSPVDLPGTKVLVAACLRKMRLRVAEVKPLRPAIALCRMPSRASASTTSLIPMGVGRGIIRTISGNWEKKHAIVDSNLPLCEDRFGEMTTMVLDFNNPTWHWSPGKVSSDFVGKQSQVDFMPISAHWKHKNLIHIDLIAWKGGGGGVTFFSYPDDIIKWKHFPRYWPFVRGIRRSLVNSPHKGQWRGAFMFSLICAWINGWVNDGEAGDSRRHRAHHDVNLM